MGPSDEDRKISVGEAFQVVCQKSQISWVMQKPHISLGGDTGQRTDAGSNPIFRTEDFRSTLDVGWIPDSGLDFFTLFLEDAHRKWKDLTEEAHSHLAKSVSNF